MVDIGAIIRQTCLNTLVSGSSTQKYVYHHDYVYAKTIEMR